MKVALDEGVPEQIARHLSGHHVQSVRELGMKGTINGELLDALEVLQFEVLISNDKKLEFDQNLERRPLCILLLSTNHLPTLEPNIEKIATALKTAEKGKITRVEVGVFVAKRIRR